MWSIIPISLVSLFFRNLSSIHVNINYIFVFLDVWWYRYPNLVATDIYVDNKSIAETFSYIYIKEKTPMVEIIY